MPKRPLPDPAAATDGDGDPDPSPASADPQSAPQTLSPKRPRGPDPSDADDGEGNPNPHSSSIAAAANDGEGDPNPSPAPQTISPKRPRGPDPSDADADSDSEPLPDLDSDPYAIFRSPPASPVVPRPSEIHAFNHPPEHAHRSLYGRVERVIPDQGLVEVAPLVPYPDQAVKRGLGHFRALLGATELWEVAHSAGTVEFAMELKAFPEEEEDVYKIYPATEEVWAVEKYQWVEIRKVDMKKDEVVGVVVVEDFKEEDGQQNFSRRLFDGCELVRLFRFEEFPMFYHWHRHFHVWDDFDSSEEMLKNHSPKVSIEWCKGASSIDSELLSYVGDYRARRYCGTRAGAETGTHKTAAPASSPPVEPSDPEKCKNEYDKLLEMDKYAESLQKLESLFEKHRKGMHRWWTNERVHREVQYVKIMMEMIPYIPSLEEKRNFLDQIQQVIASDEPVIEQFREDSGDSAEGGDDHRYGGNGRRRDGDGDDAGSIESVA